MTSPATSIYMKPRLRITPATVLYLLSLASSLLTIFMIAPLMGIPYSTWAEFNRAIGEMLRIWGVLFGVVFAFIVWIVLLRALGSGGLSSLHLRLTRIEFILVLLFGANLFWTIEGFVMGAPLTYLAGDAFRCMVIPAVYWIVVHYIKTAEDALRFTKLILWGETILLFILVPVDFIGFSFAGRTFLTTVFFTFLFEERRAANRVWYMLLLLFGIFAMLTTSAVRGIIIIFVLTIVLNYVYRLRNVRFSVVFFAFLFPAFGMIAANELFHLTLARDVESASKRFEGAVQGERKKFGLDESLFQRVGETIDVSRTFIEHSPLFLVTGFGNGVLLDNRLITRSERGIYHTQKKHHIYVMPVAVMFRNGLIGLFLYGAIVSYLIRILRKLRSHRDVLQEERKCVFIKVLVLYQIGVLLMSLIASWYIGSVVVAFTLPLIEILRRDMEKKIHEKTEKGPLEILGIEGA